MNERLCPLCDRDWEATTCPVHGVPTIGSSTGAPQRLEVGTILIERYRIDGLLGQGGMGALLTATDLTNETRVVVKVLRGERVGDLANVRRFYQEARAASALSHPSIVRILTFGLDEATRAPFFAMEFVPGRTLKAMLASDGPLSEAEAVAIFLPIARALGAAHAGGVLHRDLKPSNIMVDEAPPRVKVLDFGLAKILQDPGTAPLTQPGKTVGTPAFMAPEQVTNGNQDFRTDLYGLGCVLHAALTGGPPFTGPDIVEVMRKQVRSPAPPLPAALCDGRPPSRPLRSLHSNLLAKAPADRPASTGFVIEVFEALAEQQREPANRLGGFEQADTQVDLKTKRRVPTPTAHTINEEPLGVADEPSSRFADEETTHGPGSDETASGDELTVAHPVVTVVKAGPTHRLLLEDIISGVGGTDDVPTPMLQPTLDGELGGPSLDSGTGDPSLTSIMPASLERPGSATPADITPNAETGPAAAYPAPRAARRRPALAVRSRFRLATPPMPPRMPSPVERPLWWLMGLTAALVGLGLAFVASRGGSAPPTASEPTPRPHIERKLEVVATPRRASSQASANIEVLTVPVPAEVIVDGESMGRTPLDIERPAPEQPVEVVIRRRGYRTVRRLLKHNTPSPIEVELSL